MPPQMTVPQMQQDSVAIVPRKSAAGATVGIVIIVVLLIFGALYFWGATVNANKGDQPLPLIPGDATTIGY